MRTIKFLSLFLATSLLFTACSSDDDAGTDPTLPEHTEDSVLIINEGNFGQNNSEITYYHTNGVKQNYFSTINPGKILGQVAQSLHIADKTGLIYIVVNGSNKIEVVNKKTFKSTTTISDQLYNPRYITSDDNFLYVTNWGDGFKTDDDYISVYNLNTLSFVKKINVDEGPEKIIYSKNELYVAHKGGYGVGNSVSIINLSNNQTTRIPVGDVPTDLIKEDNYLFILASGNLYGNPVTAGKLTRYDLTKRQVDYSLNFPSDKNPSHMAEDNDQLYYTIHNEVYQMKITDTQLPQRSIFTSQAENTYGLAVKDGTIFIADALKNNSNGKVFMYSQSGALKHTIETGISPNGIYFND